VVPLIGSPVSKLGPPFIRSIAIFQQFVVSPLLAPKTSEQSSPRPDPVMPSTPTTSPAWTVRSELGQFGTTDAHEFEQRLTAGGRCPRSHLFWNPARILINVDLSDPFCPTRARTSPATMSSETACRTRASPNVLDSAPSQAAVLVPLSPPARSSGSSFTPEPCSGRDPRSAGGRPRAAVTPGPTRTHGVQTIESGARSIHLNTALGSDKP
jgi:hypothetical protein